MSAVDLAERPKLDLTNPDTFVNGHPHDLYDEARSLTPVMRQPGSKTEHPFWALLRHADIAAVGADSENFTSTKGFRVSTDNRASYDPEIGRVLSRFMLAMDDPEHAQYRKLVGAAFTPAGIRNIEPRVKARVHDLFEKIKGRNEAEFVRDIAATVPIKTVCAILGVPEADEDKVITWTDAVFGADDPELFKGPEEASRTYLSMFDYAMWLVAGKKKNPADDLMSLLVHAEIGGRPLDDTELKSYFSNLLAAGNETTRSSLAGAVWLLSRFPQQRDKLVANPDLMANAVNELLRHFSPVYQMARVAKKDVEVGGTLVREGEKVALLYGAANHDPEVFPDPHTLDIERPNAHRHLAFGIGPHFCLGSRLAQLQLRVILGELLARYPRFEVVHGPVFLRGNFVQATKSLRIKLNA
jgi:cytochrome P450